MKRMHDGIKDIRGDHTEKKGKVKDCDSPVAFEENSSFQSFGANKLSVLDVWRFLLNRKIKLLAKCGPSEVLWKIRSGIILLKVSIYGNDLKTLRRQNEGKNKNMTKAQCFVAKFEQVQRKHAWSDP